jgi:hypothetical protein
VHSRSKGSDSLTRTGRCLAPKQARATDKWLITGGYPQLLKAAGQEPIGDAEIAPGVKTLLEGKPSGCMASRIVELLLVELEL